MVHERVHELGLLAGACTPGVTIGREARNWSDVTEP
jgi:hypothetical protein